MKVKPVMDALEERGAQVILVHTGQHYDPAMSDVFFDDLDIRRPDHFLGAGSGSHAVQTGRVMTAFEPLAAELSPDVVVVVGDVNSTLACALVTAKLAVYETMRGRGWSKLKLAKQLGMPENSVRRLLDLRHSSHMWIIDEALAKMNAELLIDLPKARARGKAA